MAAIEVSHLSKNYGKLQALKDISFSVNEGEIFGLIGADGAGKSTLLRILVTLLKPDKGSASLGGYDVVKEYRKIRSVVGYMPGRFSLYQDLTVEENLRFYARVFGSDLEENYEFIELIYRQIEPFKKRRAGALSGGMKQKLALSCALIHRPEILVLDEPTTGVDAVSRNEFWELLHDIKKQEITVIVSTPYMDEAEKCDRIGLIQKGVILSIDHPSTITKDFSKVLYSVYSDQSSYPLLLKIRKEEFCHSAWLFGQNIHVSLVREDFIEDFEKAMEKYEEKPEYKRIEPGIEDTFIDLIREKT